MIVNYPISKNRLCINCGKMWFSVEDVNPQRKRVLCDSCKDFIKNKIDIRMMKLKQHGNNDSKITTVVFLKDGGMIL